MRHFSLEKAFSESWNNGRHLPPKGKANAPSLFEQDPGTSSRSGLMIVDVQIDGDQNIFQADHRSIQKPQLATVSPAEIDKQPTLLPFVFDLPLGNLLDHIGGGGVKRRLREFIPVQERYVQLLTVGIQFYIQTPIGSVPKFNPRFQIPGGSICEVSVLKILDVIGHINELRAAHVEPGRDVPLIAKFHPEAGLHIVVLTSF